MTSRPQQAAPAADDRAAAEVAQSGLGHDTDDAALIALPPQALKFWRIESLLLASAVSALTVLLFVSPLVDTAGFGWEASAAGLLALILCFDLAVVIPRRYRYHRYCVSPDGFVSVRGSIFQRRRVQPLRHILYVDVRQGPVLRACHLYRLRVGSIAEEFSEGPMTEDAVRAFQQVLSEVAA